MDKIRRLHKQEKTGFRKWISKKYYDQPDGQDIFGKLGYTTKMAAIGGSLIGFSTSVLPPTALDSKTKLLRFARVFVPSVGMAVAFTCVTYYATNFRNKDDPYNYLLGGAAAGLILGPATGMVSAAAFGAIALGAAGYAKKAAHMHRVNLIPHIKHKDFTPYTLRKLDTSLTENTRRGNWTKEAPVN